jgi:NAD(P)-dependent dehydrogenase (short-subunit alcohol dehydrogenase family)
LDLGLKGKVVVVTGSTRGIGWEIGRIFLEEGASLVLNGTNAIRCEEVSKILAIEKAKASVICADATKQTGIDKIIAHALDLHKRIDVWINNVEVYYNKLLIENGGRRNGIRFIL